jgi:hypothetical protein
MIPIASLLSMTQVLLANGHIDAERMRRHTRGWDYDAGNQMAPGYRWTEPRARVSGQQKAVVPSSARSVPQDADVAAVVAHGQVNHAVGVQIHGGDRLWVSAGGVVRGGAESALPVVEQDAQIKAARDR